MAIIKTRYFRSWDELPLILDMATISMMFQRDPQTVRSWARTGSIPAHKVGNDWFVDKDSLRKTLAAEE